MQNMLGMQRSLGLKSRTVYAHVLDCLTEIRAAQDANRPCACRYISQDFLEATYVVCGQFDPHTLVGLITVHISWPDNFFHEASGFRDAIQAMRDKHPRAIRVCEYDQSSVTIVWELMEGAEVADNPELHYSRSKPDDAAQLKSSGWLASVGFFVLRWGLGRALKASPSDAAVHGIHWLHPPLSLATYGGGHSISVCLPVTRAASDPPILSHSLSLLTQSSADTPFPIDFYRTTELPPEVLQFDELVKESGHGLVVAQLPCNKLQDSTFRERAIQLLLAFQYLLHQRCLRANMNAKTAFWSKFLAMKADLEGPVFSL